MDVVAAQHQTDRANALRFAGCWADAEAAYRRALELAPAHAEALNGLAIVLRSTGRTAEAIEVYHRAIDYHPALAGLHNNLGNALRDAGRGRDAIASYRRAIDLQPGLAEAHCHLGVMLRRRGEVEQAMAQYRCAVEARPDYAEGWNNLGNLLDELGHRAEAVACYRRALAIRPGYAAARLQKLHVQAQLCDWSDLASEAALIPELGVEGEAVAPFAAMALDDDPQRHLHRAMRYAGQLGGVARHTAFTRPSERPPRLRIGYFSADFHDHATLWLMIRLFELHDRERFDVRLYSYGPASDRPMRRRLLNAVESFIDIRHLDDAAAAELARRDRLDIAIDLKGHTRSSRLGIFAAGVAPVQISWLGFPGTIGASFIDYVLADRVVIPDEERACYSEKLIYLPGAYLPTDDRRNLAETPDRATTGLPDGSFVFCAFHNSYKIGPAEFDIWMRLLAAVDSSVLWLLHSGDEAARNLRAEAAVRGIAPDRLIFAPPLPQAEHLARHRHADLFLDCFNYNAHTSATDALYMGVPVLTRIGRSFTARVAASLLQAAGLPELITARNADYEVLASRLATDKPRLDALKRKLAANRMSEPLFRPELITRAVERAFDAVHHRYRAGEPPADIDLGP